MRNNLYRLYIVIPTTMIIATKTKPRLPPTMYEICTPSSVPVFSMAWKIKIMKVVMYLPSCIMQYINKFWSGLFALLILCYLFLLKKSKKPFHIYYLLGSSRLIRFVHLIFKQRYQSYSIKPLPEKCIRQSLDDRIAWNNYYTSVNN